MSKKMMPLLSTPAGFGFLVWALFSAELTLQIKENKFQSLIFTVFSLFVSFVLWCLLQNEIRQESGLGKLARSEIFKVGFWVALRICLMALAIFPCIVAVLVLALLAFAKFKGVSVEDADFQKPFVLFLPFFSLFGFLFAVSAQVGIFTGVTKALVRRTAKVVVGRWRDLWKWALIPFFWTAIAAFGKTQVPSDATQLLDVFVSTLFYSYFLPLGLQEIFLKTPIEELLPAPKSAT